MSNLFCFRKSVLGSGYVTFFLAPDVSVPTDHSDSEREKKGEETTCRGWQAQVLPGNFFPLHHAQPVLLPSWLSLQVVFARKT